MKKVFLPVAALLMITCCTQAPQNIPALADGDLSTSHPLTGRKKEIIFDGFSTPMQSYRIFSSDRTAQYDPESWILYGSHDGKKWTELDRRENISFCSRFQPAAGQIGTPSDYSSYKIRFTAPHQDSLFISEVKFSPENTESAWSSFRYPEVNFEIRDPETEGARIYQELVQDPEEFIRYHAREVARILFYSAEDTMNHVGKINYILKNYRGISAKSGNPAETTIMFSTRHVENSAEESLARLDYETRGVLVHELVHAYQFEPKGIGTYGTSKEFWACVEGMADGVRAQAGLFDIQKLRKPGGHWLDGYKTTGFFLQWLTEKDPDALRKFNITVRDMEKWSFDGAMKRMYGRSIEEMWNEYQNFLKQQ